MLQDHTAIYLPTNALKAYIKATGGVKQPNNDKYSINSTQFAKLQPLTFKLGNHSYALTADAQIYPRSRNAEINGTVNGYYLIVQEVSPFG